MFQVPFPLLRAAAAVFPTRIPTSSSGAASVPMITHLPSGAARDVLFSNSTEASHQDSVVSHLLVNAAFHVGKAGLQRIGEAAIQWLARRSRPQPPQIESSSPTGVQNILNNRTFLANRNLFQYIPDFFQRFPHIPLMNPSIPRPLSSQEGNPPPQDPSPPHPENGNNHTSQDPPPPPPLLPDENDQQSDHGKETPFPPLPIEPIDFSDDEDDSIGPPIGDEQGQPLQPLICEENQSSSPQEDGGQNSSDSKEIEPTPQPPPPTDWTGAIPTISMAMMAACSGPPDNTTTPPTTTEAPNIPPPPPPPPPELPPPTTPIERKDTIEWKGYLYEVTYYCPESATNEERQKILKMFVNILDKIPATEYQPGVSAFAFELRKDKDLEIFLPDSNSQSQQPKTVLLKGSREIASNIAEYIQEGSPIFLYRREEELEQKDVDRFPESEPKQNPPIGLCNTKNTCYAALVQICSAIPTLRNSLIEKEETRLSEFLKQLEKEKENQESHYSHTINAQSLFESQNIIEIFKDIAPQVPIILTEEISPAEKAPEMFMIHTKRIPDSMKNQKTLDTYMTLKKDNPRYRRRGFLVREGNTKPNEHDVAYVEIKAQDGSTKYYKIDNHQRFELPRILYLEASKQSYLAFYEKVTSSPKKASADDQKPSAAAATATA